MLAKLEKSARDDFSGYGDNQFCRNSDADMMAPWCHVRYGRRIAKETCDVPNCMEFDTDDDRVVKHRYNFNIRSLDGKQTILVLAVFYFDQSRAFLRKGVVVVAKSTAIDPTVPGSSLDGSTFQVSEVDPGSSAPVSPFLQCLYKKKIEKDQMKGE